MAPALAVDPALLQDLCRRHHVAKLELFGSRAKGTERPDSDVDLLVTFAPGYIPGLEFFGIADELSEVFGHPVDLFTRESIEQMPNLYKRASILASVEPIYVAA